MKDLVRLFCFPHAGSSAGVYARWSRELPPWIDLRAVELPGHGRRIAEPLLTEMPRLVHQLADELTDEFESRFAFFGHSLGGIVAFEVAQRIRSSTGREPCVLCISGSSAPNSRDRERYARLDSDRALLNELQALDGTPEAALEDRQLMELALPVLRADFKLCASYASSSHEQLGCPVRVVGGTADSSVTTDDLMAWRDYTTGEFSLEMFEGGHFFVHEQRPAVLRWLVDCLRDRRAAPPRIQPAHELADH